MPVIKASSVIISHFIQLEQYYPSHCICELVQKKRSNETEAKKIL